MASPLIQDAVIRDLEVIGEAGKRISDKLKDGYPDVPWRNIAGLRNILIHQYMEVDIAEVWNIIERDLPLLKGRSGKCSMVFQDEVWNVAQNILPHITGNHSRLVR